MADIDELRRLRKEIEDARRAAREYVPPAPTAVPTSRGRAAPETARAAEQARWDLERSVTRREERAGGREALQTAAERERRTRYVRAYADLDRYVAEERARLSAPPFTNRQVLTDWAAYDTLGRAAPRQEGRSERDVLVSGEFPPIESLERLRGYWPWSEYGQEMLRTVPWTGEQTDPHKPVALFRPGGGPEAKGEVKFSGLGYVAGHEYGHAAAAPWWDEDTGARYMEDVIGWMRSKPLEEMSPDELWFVDMFYAYGTRLGPGELYAMMAERPQAIPRDLGFWFPQYDLSRRRAMGVPQPPGYQGPTLTQFGGKVPPPPHGVGSGK